MKKLLIALILCMLLPLGLAAQGSYTLTTTTAALTVTSDIVYVTTATVSSTAFTAGNLFLIEHEVFQIKNTYVSGLAVPVNRGYSGTLVTPHVTASPVLVGPPSYFAYNDRFGTCTATSSMVIPQISINRTTRDVQMFNCNNGRWVAQTLLGDQTDIGGTNPCNGGLDSVPMLITGFSSYGASTATVAGTIYYSSINVPMTTYVTGLRVLNGGAVGSDLVIYSLYRSDGTLVANTATAGSAAAGQNGVQAIAFTAPYVATGPARYWIGASGNGTTATFRMITTQLVQGVLASSMTGTFGTLAAISVPPALITNTGPVGCLY